MSKKKDLLDNPLFDAGPKSTTERVFRLTTKSHCIGVITDEFGKVVHTHIDYNWLLRKPLMPSISLLINSNRFKSLEFIKNQ